MREAREPKSEPTTLAEVEAIAAQRRPAFPDWLERRFETETGARYGKILAQDLRRTAFYYNVMVAADFLLTPDAALIGLGLHFLVVTPALLGLAAFCRLRVSPLARDLAAAAAPFLIACQVMATFAVSAAATASHYVVLVAMHVATVNSALRLRHRSAAWSTYATFAALPLVQATTHKEPLQVAVMQCFSLGISGLVTLRGMADREREFRRAYLVGLRDRLRIAASDDEANHDPLTGATNRRGLDLAVRKLWAEARPGAPVAVVLFDVDRFKAYNDMYGHPAGDACLRRIAEAMQETLRGRDALLARYGGEEFIALLTDGAAQEAEATAEAMRRAVLGLNIVHAGAVEGRIVSASFGVASGHVGEIGFEALTAGADSALYAAKSAGRNRVTCALAA